MAQPQEKLQQAAETENQDLLSSQSKCDGSYKALVIGITGYKQSKSQFDGLVHAAAMDAIKHAEMFLDARPIKRVIDELMKDKDTEQWGPEVNAWVREFSPVRFNSKGDVRIAKEGEPGFKPFDLEAAEGKPFSEMDQVIASREEAKEAARRTLKPVEYKNVVNRFKGVNSWFKNSLTEIPEGQEEPRGVVESQREKCERLIIFMDNALSIFEKGGPIVEAIVNNSADASSTMADSKGQNRASVRAAKTEARETENQAINPDAAVA